MLSHIFSKSSFSLHASRLLIAAALLLSSVSASAFTVVIDAGHGGHDAGAIGAYSKEKNINLKYALLVGELLKEKNPEIKVIFTRDKDVFVELKERAAIANRNDADLFVSIHTNSSKGRTANGMETFTLGASRSKENMEVAMLENSVILLEEDHEKSYEGFDPNSTDSYIMFEFMKDQYSNFSIQCADHVQSRIVRASGRADRGVRQAGFLVLRATTMPSILIELGFISNREEEKFLNQSSNQALIAGAIYEGIISYKHEIDKKGGEDSAAPADSSSSAGESVTEEAPAVSQSEAADGNKAEGGNAPAETAPEAAGSENEGAKAEAQAEKSAEGSGSPAAADESGTLLYVQFLASSTLFEEGDAALKGMTGVTVKNENGMYKYMVGGTVDLLQLDALKNKAKKSFPQAFTVAYRDGKKVDARKAIADIKKR